MRDDIVAKALLADKSLCDLCLFNIDLSTNCQLALVESDKGDGPYYYNKTHMNSVKYKHTYVCKGFQLAEDFKPIELHMNVLDEAELASYERK